MRRGKRFRQALRAARAAARILARVEAAYIAGRSALADVARARVRYGSRDAALGRAYQDSAARASRLDTGKAE